MNYGRGKLVQMFRSVSTTTPTNSREISERVVKAAESSRKSSDKQMVRVQETLPMHVRTSIRN